MLYVPLLADFCCCNKGTSNVLQGGGGQQSTVKDHTFTFFFGTLFYDYKIVSEWSQLMRLTQSWSITNWQYFGVSLGVEIKDYT